MIQQHLVYSLTRKNTTFVKPNFVSPWRKAQKSVIISDQTKESKNPKVFDLQVSHQHEDSFVLSSRTSLSNVQTSEPVSLHIQRKWGIRWHTRVSYTTNVERVTLRYMPIWSCWIQAGTSLGGIGMTFIEEDNAKEEYRPRTNGWAFIGWVIRRSTHLSCFFVWWSAALWYVHETPGGVKAVLLLAQAGGMDRKKQEDAFNPARLRCLVFRYEFREGRVG